LFKHEKQEIKSVETTVTVQNLFEGFTNIFGKKMLTSDILMHLTFRNVREKKRERQTEATKSNI
jgi:hypothetical protein